MTIQAGQQATAADQLQVHNADGTLKDAIVGRNNLSAALALSLNQLCQGRLTLTAGTPATTADVTGATSVYFSPYKGRSIALYDGSSAWDVLSFTETQLALGTLTSGRPYDVFGYNNSGTLGLEALSWTSDTARATALTLQDGILSKTGALTRRYLGTFRTTATTTTEDSAAKRFLWNYYHRVRKTMRNALETANSWSWGTASYQQANANTANQLDFVIGWSEDMVDAHVTSSGLSAAGGVSLNVGIGLDSTTTNSAQLIGPNIALATQDLFTADYNGFPGVGRHFLAWLEKITGAGSATFYGDNNTPTQLQSGISGSIWC